MRIERHVFGSYSGYTTLARSPGVSADDARTLESMAFSFGQSNERSYLKSLARQPAYFTRLVSGGRRGLTRVLEGDPDDNNRPTIRLITLIVSQRDWDAQLCGDVELLLGDGDLWEWDGSSALPAIDVMPAAPSLSLPRKNVEKVLALVAETEKAVASRRPLLVSAEDYCYADLRALEMLIPPAARRQFTSAFRSLSVQLPVNVNVLAGEAGLQGRSAFRYVAGASASPYATYLAGTELSGGSVPVEAVAGYRQFAQVESGALASPAVPAPRNGPLRQVHRQQRGSPLPWILAALLGLGLCAVTFFIGKSTGSSQTLAIEQARQEQQRQEHEATSSKAIAEQSANYRERLKKAMDVPGDSFDELVTASASKLADLRSAATTAARDSAADRDRYRSAYEAEMARQRDRFVALRAEAAAAMAVKDIRKFNDAGQILVRIDGELKSLADDWPASGADERKWLAELQATRQRVHAATAIASVLARIGMLLDECEDTMGSFAGAAADNVQANVVEVMELAGHLPSNSDAAGADIAAFRSASMARAQKVRAWLAEQHKSAEKLTIGEPPCEPGRDGWQSWWKNLKPEQREKIKKWVEDKGKHDASSSTGDRSAEDRPPSSEPRSN